LDNGHSTFKNKLIAYVNTGGSMEAGWYGNWQNDEETIHRILEKPSSPTAWCIAGRGLLLAAAVRR